MTKVLHIITSLKVGGAESLLAQLIPCLQEKGVDCTVIYFYDGPNVERLKHAGIKVVHVWGKFYKYDPFFFVRFFLTVKKINPNYIHTHLWLANVLGVLAGKLFKVPVISTIHLLSTLEKSASSSKFRFYVDKLILKFVQEVILVSPQMVNKFQERYLFVPAKKIRVIPNGIDYDAVTNKGLEEKITRSFYQIDDKAFVFGSVGRLIGRKNYNLLINIFSRIKNPSAFLLIIGSGAEENRLRILIKELNLSAKVKIISDNLAYKYFQLMNAYISVSAEEGLSLALLEAMSFSLPLILQKEINSNHDLLTDNYNGLSSQTEDDILFAMNFLLSNQKLSKEFGQNSRILVEEKYSLNGMAEKYKRIYEKF